MRTAIVALSGIVLWGVACSSMRRVDAEQFIPIRKPNAVSVWTMPDSMTIVSDPVIDGDSLRGQVLQQPWSAALTKITKVEALRPDHTRTALLVAGVAASVAGMALLVSGPRKAMPRAECTDTDDITC